MSASTNSTPTLRPAARRRAFSTATAEISMAVTSRPCSASQTELRPSPSATDSAVRPFCSPGPVRQKAVRLGAEQIVFAGVPVALAPEGFLVH
jgi:endogenous inhibitor of DNA gyrase (YacG/DUF329 family)